MLPAGSWKLDAATLPRLDSSSSSNNGNKHAQQATSNSTSTQPPKAIFVRLSDELLQQLKAAQSGNHVAFHLELGTSSSSGTPTASASGSGSSKTNAQTPVAINLGENSYPLAKSVNNNQSRNKVTDILLQPSSNASSSSSLQIAASNIHEQYAVGPSKSIRHINLPKEKTAANMGERIRERNAQMQKEKESRKIVIVEDDGFSSSGGKGKKPASKVSKAQPNLLRANAINAKRSASPAGIAPRQSPSLAPSATLTTTIARPPSRLVANEAAKGLMKKSDVLQNVLGTVNDTKTVDAIEGTASTVASPGEKAVSSNTPPTSAQQPVLSSQSNKPSLTVATADKSKLAAPPAHGSPARRQYHQMKVDADDLASASSDSEDDDDKPLAVRTQSPIKTHFHAEQLSKPIPNPPMTRINVAQGKMNQTASQESIRPIPKPVLAESSTSASESSDKETTEAKPSTTIAADAALPKRLSPDSTPASRASSPARAVGGPKVVAKTSGGSRLSKPVPKVSPRNSPKPAPVASTLPPDSGVSVSSTLSTSTIGLSTPPSSTVEKPATKSEPIQSEAMMSKSVSLSVDAVAKPASRAPSPLPSPGAHPLPAKPPVSPSFKRSDTLPSPNRHSPAPTISATTDRDKSPSQLSRPTTLSIGLPANPITGIMPNIPKSPSSLHPLHHHSSYLNHTPSAQSTPAASPIISHFPSSNSNGASKSPNSGPLRTTTNGSIATKRKDAPVKSQAEANLSDSAVANKKQKLSHKSSVPIAPSPLSATSGSEEDGEAEEEEEGEYRTPTVAKVNSSAPVKEEKKYRGRPNDVKPVKVESAKIISEKPKVVSKGGLPSFTKKGRMSELQKEKGRDDSLPPRSQSASRANTPISNDSMDIDSVDGPLRTTSARYKPKFTGRLHITDEVDFARYRAEFKDKLYPEYVRQYARLEKLKEDLLDPRNKGSAPSFDCSPQQIARMVDEVNERSKELERIKLGLWQYDDDRKNRKDGNLRTKT